MKKILFLVESLTGGGAERVLTDLVKNLDKSSFDVTVKTVVDAGVYRKDMKAMCRYSSFLRDPEEIQGNFKKLLYKVKYKLIYSLPAAIIYRYFIREKYDVEVAFLEGFSTKIISGSNNKSSKKLAWVHVDPISRDYADRYYRNHKHQLNSYNKFDNVLCVSKSVADAFNNKFKLRKKAVVQYNPVDKESIVAKSKQQIDIVKDRITMVTAGRLVDQKGYDRLVQVCKRLKDDGFKFYLWILGEGEQRSFLEKYICENNLHDTIKLMGFCSNPYPYIKMADIFVCSSRAEGYSTVVTEAIILSKAVITTECAGMYELLGDNEYGIIVPNDAENIYLGLKKVLSEVDIVRRYSEKAMIRSKEFTLENIMNQIEGAFR